jgi:hypothetical protein
MAVTELFSLLSKGVVHGSKSTAMSPLIWAMAILMGGVVGGPSVGLPPPVHTVLSGCLVVVVTGFLAAFGYFAVTNPDALRTEKYTLTKLAIEHHLSGDDMAGITTAIEDDGGKPQAAIAALTPPDPKQRKPRTAKQEKTLEATE